MSRFNPLRRQRDEKKNIRAKERNKARKQFRIDHPQHRGKQLNCWPLPTVA